MLRETEGAEIYYSNGSQYSMCILLGAGSEKSCDNVATDTSQSSRETPILRPMKRGRVDEVGL